MLIGGVLKVFETGKLTEVLVVSIIGKDVLAAKNVELVYDSVLVVTFFLLFL